MRIRLTLFTLAAAASLALSACGQQKTESAPPPETTAPAPAAADDAIPADLSATAPDGISPPTKFAGEAPAETSIDVIPAPPPAAEAKAEDAPKPGAIDAAPPPASKPLPDIAKTLPGGELERNQPGARARDEAASAPSSDKRAGSVVAGSSGGSVLGGVIGGRLGGAAGGGAAAPSAPPPPPPPPPPSASISRPTAPPIAAGAVRSAPRSTTSASEVVMSKKADGTTKVTVYFATDRKMEVKNNVRRFTGDEVNGLYYGTVDVSIPPVHEVGAVESPEWWKMEFTADPEKHVVYQGFNLLKRDNFYGELSKLISQSTDKEAFVFVHGFNTPFEEAARRTAQIEYDLKFNGAPIFYSWPSQGELSPFAYNKDATSSDRTVPRLKFFLKEVAQRTGAKRIHLIAHSMGNKAMVNALARIADEMTTGQAPLFNQIVLTAPDIDREVFLDVAQRIKKTGSQVTLYASKNDKALIVSKTYNGFARAGDTSPSPVVLPGIFTIDASAVTTDYFGLNHDFFASQKTVLGDLTKLLVTGATPDGRKLRKVKAADGQFYWVID